MTIKPLVPELKALFYALPKAELHVHLAGAYPKYKIREFFREKGIPEREIAKVTSPQDLYNDLTDFVNFYMTIAGLVKTEEQIEQAAFAICIKAAEDNVRYMELKLASSELDPDRTQDAQERVKVKEKMYKAVKRGVNKAKEQLAQNGFKQTVKFMYTAERHEAPMFSLEDSQLAVKWANEPDSDFVALDLAGDEVNFSVERHAAALNYAREHNLNITCHAGETLYSEQLSNVESMKKSIKLGAKRIGHGLAVCNDPELLKLVKENNITIEVSPSSNIATMSVKSWSDHPIRKMLDEGVNVALCSDDPAMFNTKITREYERLYMHNLLNSWDEIKKLVMTGIMSSFAPENEKQELAEEFKKELEFIENDPYFKKVIEKYLS